MTPTRLGLFRRQYLILVFLLVTRVRVYAHLGCGWGSNSLYAIVGGLRGVAQRVSYEVSMVVLLVSIRLLGSSLDMVSYSTLQYLTPWAVVAAPLGCLW